MIEVRRKKYITEKFLIWDGGRIYHHRGKPNKTKTQSNSNATLLTDMKGNVAPGRNHPDEIMGRRRCLCPRVLARRRSTSAAF
jgi:hypothetical protein